MNYRKETMNGTNGIGVRDSLFLDDDVFQDLGLYHLFARVISRYDTWGPNKISQAQWEQIKAEAAEFGPRGTGIFAGSGALGAGKIFRRNRASLF